MRATCPSERTLTHAVPSGPTVTACGPAPTGMVRVIWSVPWSNTATTPLSRSATKISAPEVAMGWLDVQGAASASVMARGASGSAFGNSSRRSG